MIFSSETTPKPPLCKGRGPRQRWKGCLFSIFALISFHPPVSCHPERNVVQSNFCGMPQKRDRRERDLRNGYVFYKNIPIKNGGDLPRPTWFESHERLKKRFYIRNFHSLTQASRRITHDPRTFLIPMQKSHQKISPSLQALLGGGAGGEGRPNVRRLRRTLHSNGALRCFSSKRATQKTLPLITHLRLNDTGAIKEKNKEPLGVPAIKQT